MMSTFLIIEITLYLKRQDYLFNKFLLERYLNNYKFKKIKIINNKNNMYKDKRHMLKDKNKYILEKDYLKERFKR